MSYLEELMSGGPDYRVVPDIGGAIFAPTGDTREERLAFHRVAERIVANDGAGYRVQLKHRSSDDSDGFFDRIIINTNR